MSDVDAVIGRDPLFAASGECSQETKTLDHRTSVRAICDQNLLVPVELHDRLCRPFDLELLKSWIEVRRAYQEMRTVCRKTVFETNRCAKFSGELMQLAFDQRTQERDVCIATFGQYDGYWSLILKQAVG